MLRHFYLHLLFAFLRDDNGYDDHRKNAIRFEILPKKKKRCLKLIRCCNVCFFIIVVVAIAVVVVACVKLQRWSAAVSCGHVNGLRWILMYQSKIYFWTLCFFFTDKKCDCGIFCSFIFFVSTSITWICEKEKENIIELKIARNFCIFWLLELITKTHSLCIYVGIKFDWIDWIISLSLCHRTLYMYEFWFDAIPLENWITYTHTNTIRHSNSTWKRHIFWHIFWHIFILEFLIRFFFLSNIDWMW